MSVKRDVLLVLNEQNQNFSVVTLGLNMPQTDTRTACLTPIRVIPC